MTKKRFVKLLMADGIGRNSVTEFVHFITCATHATFDYEGLYRNLKESNYVQEIYGVFPNGGNIDIGTITIGKNKCFVTLSDNFKKFLSVLKTNCGSYFINLTNIT